MINELTALLSKSLLKHFGNGYNLAEDIATDLIQDGWIKPPCKPGDTVYKIRKFCEVNTGYREEYRGNNEFNTDCPYLEPANWFDDCDRCKAITDYDEACYCTVNLKILCDTCKSRLVIQKDKFTWSKMNQIFNTPMFNTNTDLYDTYFITEEDAEEKLKEILQKEG